MSRRPPAGRSPLVVLFLTVFIDLMGFGIVIPLLPIYAKQMHATRFDAGALIAVYSLMQLVFAPAWGRISDDIGRRPVLLMSLAGSAMSYLLLAAAWRLEVLFLARVLAGVAGASIPVAQAYIADVTGPAERARGMGLIGAAFGLGMVIGPALGGGLSLLGPRVPEGFAAGLCLANVLVAAYRLPESLPGAVRRPAPFRHPLSPASLREAVARPGAASLLAVFFLVTLGFAVLEGTFSLAADGYRYTQAQVDWLWVYMGLVAVLVQGWLVGRLARRLSERALVLLGTAALGLGFLWIPFAGPAAGLPIGLLTALALVVGGQGLASPSLSSLISKTVEESDYGQALGVSQSLSAGARALGPAGGGFIFDRMEASATYLAAAVCAAGALGLSLLGTRPGGEVEAQVIRVRGSG
ncbi:MAG TPA: MFS transporter [Candidatus Limnocylindria bacterium]|nr:MFS transporter [Candidatus Limnocylindria bacterium]